MKNRYRLTIAYDGTHYVGWQIQRNGLSIQEKLTEVIGTITGQKIRPMGAGRTDSGVHALGQVAHLDLDWKHSTNDLLNALNSLLPEDIRVLEATEAPHDFHAQRSAKQKWYRYVVHVGAGSSRPSMGAKTAPLLFERAYAWQIDFSLKLGKMRQAAKMLTGRHDFASFQGSGASVKTTVRNLQKIEITRIVRDEWPFCHREEPIGRRGDLLKSSETGRLPRRFAPRNDKLGQDPQKGHWLLFDFLGEGFLKQMVRNMVGTLVDVGRGVLTPQEVTRILAARDRKKAGLCAPPHGLYLMKICY